MTKRDTNPHYRKVRAEVKKRDKGTCQFPSCKKRRGIQVHHILRHANNPLIRESEKNLICLCRDHHKQVTGHEETYGPLFASIVASKSKKP